MQIAAQGKTAALQSFADWIESSSMLVTKVELMGLDACPAEKLTTKFPHQSAARDASSPPPRTAAGPPATSHLPRPARSARGHPPHALHAP